MKIINVSKNTILAEDVIMADTLFKRMKGLLGRKELRNGQAIILSPCNSIHTFFMRFPIDVLFVDKNNRIIKTFPLLRPFRCTGIYFNTCFAIELPCSTISSSFTTKGDSILIKRDTL